MKIYCCVLFVGVLWVSSSFAQVPTGTLVHLSGEAGVVVSGGKIIEWDDLVNPSIKFVAPLAGNQPSPSSSLINGHKAVTFDGATNYLLGPSIFPVNHDYTICVVAKTANFALENNLVSGTTHALFLGAGIYPRMLHANFASQAISTQAVTAAPSLIIARYNQANTYASFRVNGASGDSGVVGANLDSTVYIGAYAASSFFGGDLAEVIIYPRYLSDTEQALLEDTLLKKYAIEGPQPPDRTFSSVPRSLELYPRGTDDSATVPIMATVPAKGFDSVYVKVLRNSAPYQYFSKSLSYEPSGAPFYFFPRIHAELSEYAFIIGVKSATEDSILRRSDSVVCGDAYIVTGQSNSIAGGDSYSNEFCRTYGANASQARGDTLWELATGSGYGGGPNVGAFGMRIQRDFVERYGIPTVIINGGVGGTPIETHLPDNANPMNLQTFYGSMLYRARTSGLANYVKAIFWYQGESNSITNYFDNFEALSNGWRIDYPNLKKIYVVQVRPGCNSGTAGELRDLLRQLSRYYPDVVAHTTMGLPGHNGCHFFLDTLSGYHMLGDQLFDLLGRDFYHKTDTAGINSPDILKAYYADADHRTVDLVFQTSGSDLVLPNDTITSGVSASLKDYFYVGTDTGIVTNLTVNKDTLVLHLSRSSAGRTVTYLPDVNYNGAAVIYEGPWLFNKRGLGAFSFWNVPIDEYVNAVAVQSPAQQSFFAINPNPSDGVVDISYSLLHRSMVKIEIMNLLGQEVATVRNEVQSAGAYKDRIDISTLQAGSYFVRFVSDANNSVKIIAIVK